MHVATVRLTLHLPRTFSLKDKRHTLRHLIERLKHDFNVSVAEVDAQDDLRSAVIGIALVSNDGRFNQRVIDRLLSRVQANPDVTVERCDRESI